MRALVMRLTERDQRLVSALALRQAPAWMDRSLRWVTHAGDASMSIALCLVLLALPATRPLGILAALANLSSHVMVQLLKRTMVRRRPSVLLPHIHPLIAIPDHYSFPSGHSCAAMAIAMSVMLTEPLLGIPALLIALAVGVSRVYLRVHYPTDVLVGQILGAGAAVLVSSSLS
jgi:undecaprenyl-diphosphatase